jgi:protein phosphatase 1 regulatory subunit 11
VVDNEGMGRKSSKRCCIFHKQRAFGESSTDSSDYDHDHDHDDQEDGSGAGKHRKIARKKNQGASANENTKKDRKTPDHLRFHA